MKRFGLILFILMLAVMGQAQNHGSLNLNKDSRIDALIQKQKDLYSIDSSSNGYRIHIFMEIGNEALKHAESMKRKFEAFFPEIPIYLTYAEPYFRLRAGDFRNRVEAEKCLRRVKPYFREAFVTADIIYQPKIQMNTEER